MKIKKQFTNKEFIKILNDNGFFLLRTKGSHFIYSNSDNKHITITNPLNIMIAKRLIKENKLKID